MSKRAQEARARLGAAIERVDRVLERLLQQGLQRVSRSSVEELGAVAQTAHAAGMIRVEREIEALRTHITRYLDADPLYRTADLLAVTNRAWLINRAAKRRLELGEGPAQMVDLLGEARRRYVPVEGRLQIQPLAASGWLTPTGFLGITVYLLATHEDGETRQLQASTVRPSMAFGVEPRVLLHQGVSPTSGLTLHEVAHIPMTLEGAKISADGRLSLGGDLRTGPAPDGGLASLSTLAVDGFAALVDRLRAQEVDVLAVQSGVLAYVEPAEWGALVHDDKRARVRAALLDAAGAVLWLQVPLARENQLWVDNLERLERRRPRGLVGRVSAAGGELRLEPYTAIYDEGLTLGGRGSLTTNRLHLGLVELARVRGSR